MSIFTLFLRKVLNSTVRGNTELCKIIIVDQYIWEKQLIATHRQLSDLLRKSQEPVSFVFDKK